MAKTIKFNLILDGYPVRNLEGLQEHFSIEDILKYFRNGLLLRWLEVRGYTKEYAAVNEIDVKKENREIISELIKIFEVELDDSLIEEEIVILSYLEQEDKMNAAYKENDFEKKRIISDYHRGYDSLVQHMEENKENMAVLKADTIQMEKAYAGLFKLDQDHLYFRLFENAPKAIFAMLTRNLFRNFWLSEEENALVGKHIRTTLLTPANVKEILGDDLRIVKRNTQAMWDQIERSEVRVMVISIDSGTFVKNAGEFAEKLANTDVNGKLLILNGLEYQCNNVNYELRYMGV